MKKTENVKIDRMISGTNRRNLGWGVASFGIEVLCGCLQSVRGLPFPDIVQLLSVLRLVLGMMRTVNRIVIVELTSIGPLGRRISGMTRIRREK
jgi:hypothetical protein